MGRDEASSFSDRMEYLMVSLSAAETSTGYSRVRVLG